MSIMPGGGISEDNLGELRDVLRSADVTEYHASAKVKQASRMTYQNDKCQMGPSSDDYALYVTSRERVQAMCNILRS